MRITKKQYETMYEFFHVLYKLILEENLGKDCGQQIVKVESESIDIRLQKRSSDNIFTKIIQVRNLNSKDTFFEIRFFTTSHGICGLDLNAFGEYEKLSANEILDILILVSKELLKKYKQRQQRIEDNQKGNEFHELCCACCDEVKFDLQREREFIKLLC